MLEAFRVSLTLLLCVVLPSCALAQARAHPRDESSALTPASQATHEALPPVTLESLLEAAQIESPKLKSARERQRAMETRPSQAQALPNPIIGIASTSMSNPVPFSQLGQDPLNSAGIEISQEVPFPGKLRLKGALASSEAAQSAFELTLVERRLKRELTEAYLEYWSAFHSQRLLKSSQAEIDNLARVARSRYEVGRAEQRELLRAQVEAALLESRLIDAAQSMALAQTRINALMGRAGDTSSAAPADPVMQAPAQALPSILERLRSNSPRLASAQAQLTRAGLAEALAERDFYPDMLLGGYYGVNGDLPEMYQLRLGFKVPLYRSAKEEQALQEAQHARLSAVQERAAAQAELEAEVAASYYQAQAAQRQILLFQKTIIPSTRLAYESDQRRYEAGQSELSDVLLSLVAVRERESGLRAAQELRYKSLARLHELVGDEL